MSVLHEALKHILKNSLNVTNSYKLSIICTIECQGTSTAVRVLSDAYYLMSLQYHDVKMLVVALRSLQRPLYRFSNSVLAWSFFGDPVMFQPQ